MLKGNSKMTPQIIKINSQRPEKRIIQRVAEIIKKGGLVAFPTETVYGLGANALNKKAVRKIFEVKGRPLDNPIIVHIAEVKDLKKLARDIPKEVEILVHPPKFCKTKLGRARKFWPGPLTLVLFKKKIVPDEVTAGADTVAIRMPKNKVALELIKNSGFPIAAPSANLAGKPSPTQASHVFEDLGKRVDLILDGGRTKVGVESTVVDLTVKPPLILRPGGISFEELKKVLKDIQLHLSLSGKKFQGEAKSPGMKYRHYAPKAPLILVEGDLKKRLKKFKDLISFYKKSRTRAELGTGLIPHRNQVSGAGKKKKIGIMISKETKKFLKKGDVNLVVGSRKNLKEISRNLFTTLRKFDEKRVDVILTETFPEKGIGFAIMHRLRKAAEKIT